MLSAICFNLEQSKVLSSGNGLNDNILASSKLKASIFVDNKTNVTYNLKFVFEREEKFLGNGENAGLHFPKCFQKPPSYGSLKVEIL